MVKGFQYNRFFQSFTEYEKKFAPEQLFVEGNAALLYSGLKVCIVGSRKPGADGIADAECLSRSLVSNGVIVVSGLAEGIDTVAHKKAIEAGGQTIAVLGTPLNEAYPRKNAGLLDQIRRNHLAVSQFPIGYPTRKENFPMRNRTMALLSDATIIVEASETSGTRHQGWEALRLGRTVFLMESVARNPALSWPKEMMKYGAQELSCELLPTLLYDIPNVTARLKYA